MNLKPSISLFVTLLLVLSICRVSSAHDENENRVNSTIRILKDINTFQSILISILVYKGSRNLASVFYWKNKEDEEHKIDSAIIAFYCAGLLAVRILFSLRVN